MSVSFSRDERGTGGPPDACAGAARARLSASRGTVKRQRWAVRGTSFRRFFSFIDHGEIFYRQLNPIGKWFFMQAPLQELLPCMSRTSVRVGYRERSLHQISSVYTQEVAIRRRIHLALQGATPMGTAKTEFL